MSVLGQHYLFFHVISVDFEITIEIYGFTRHKIEEIDMNIYQRIDISFTVEYYILPIID